MFENRLALLRKESSKTKKEVAEYLGIPYNTYANYESDTREPNAEMLVRIAEYFDVSLDWLLGRTEVRSASSDTRALCANTGLSEKAVISLQHCDVLKRNCEELASHGIQRNNGCYLGFVNFLLEDFQSGAGAGLLINLSKYLENTVVDNEELYGVKKGELLDEVLYQRACRSLREAKEIFLAKKAKNGN